MPLIPLLALIFNSIAVSTLYYGVLTSAFAPIAPSLVVSYVAALAIALRRVYHSIVWFVLIVNTLIIGIVARESLRWVIGMSIVCVFLVDWILRVVPPYRRTLRLVAGSACVWTITLGAHGLALLLAPSRPPSAAVSTMFGESMLSIPLFLALLWWHMVLLRFFFGQTTRLVIPTRQ